MTVREILRQTTERLHRAGVESARTEAEWLLAHVLRLPRLELFLEQSRVLSGQDLAALEALLVRRETREPLQHLLGTAEFCGRVFAVNRHVLIPRPETELLAQWAVKVGQASSPSHPCSGEREFAAISTAQSAQPTATFSTSNRERGEVRGSSVRLLDFGTGSGCLAITLALELPGAEVHAVDLSPEALAVARANATALGVADRITFHLGDGFHALPAGLRFDLIVTNPPYIPTAEIATLQPEVRDFDPALALDGGPDGLDFYRRLAKDAPTWLNPDGQLLAEFGEGQGPDLRALFDQAGWTVEAILPDDTGRERMLHAIRL